MKKIATIILAAGKGTRMKSEKPKVLFELAEKTLIQRVIDTSREINAELIVPVVGYKKDLVISSIENKENLVFVEQKQQNGTGDAVRVTSEVFKNFKGNILILCGDVPLLKAETLKKLLDFHNEKNASCTVLTAVLDDPAKYGRILRNENGNVEKIVEFKDANDEIRKIKEINTGIYCFDAQDLFKALKQIDNNNAQNEYYLTDTLEILNKEGKIVTSMITPDFSETLGVNSQKQLTELETIFYGKIKEKWLLNGVMIENPDTVIIGEDVKIAADVYIGANSLLKGKTIVEKDVKIGNFCYIKNSLIQKGSLLKGFNTLINAKVNENETLGFYEKRV